MTKGPDNIWTVTTTPLVVGFHYYTLRIDGATVSSVCCPCPDQQPHTCLGIVEVTALIQLRGDLEPIAYR